VPGGEVAGVREDTGARVVALSGTGGYAEYATAPEALTFPIPDGVDDGTALALLIQGLTAWHLYRTSGRVGAGESVAIVAAAGGVGSLAVQLGKPMGAGRVIALASTQAKRDLALELGADVAIDSDAEGLKERLEEANAGRKVDVVFEMAGGPVFDACLAALAPFGRLVTYGIASGDGNEVHSRKLMGRSRAVVGFWLMHCIGRPEMVDEALADLYARAARGELRAVVGATYALSDARQAQIDLAGRRTTGKVLLDPSG
jgi:NADPH2:quinone reductase